MGTFEFDGEKYRSASKHQKEWGSDLIAEISFEGNEAVLDLGCGDGILTERLARFVPHGTVLGIDASVHMLKIAETIHKNNLKFACLDINKMNYTDEFDLVFSNAALHWVKDHKKLLKNAYRALKANGKIWWDFGGSGNCANFFDVIKMKISEDNYVKYFTDYEWPWFMPSKEQYTELIAEAGFASWTIRELNRDRYFSDTSEMIRWIDQPSLVPFIQQIPQELKETFRREVIEEMVKRTQQPDGTCFETFRRIRICAGK